MEKVLEVIILIGIAASGKSTWCKDFLRKNPNYARINRDDFRFMLRNEAVCEPKVEDMITDLFYQAIDAALARKMSVIVDNTNLKKRYIDDLVAHVEHRANVRFEVRDISLEKAIERDNAREKKVGELVLEKMYKDYRDLMDGFSYINQSKKNYIYKDPTWDAKLPMIVIFDIDGTLSHANSKRGYFDWHRVDVDDLDKVVHDIYVLHKNAGDRIFVITGRDEAARTKTEEWLAFYGITYDQLLMRKMNDMRKDNIVKAEIYNHYIKGKYNVKVVYDDRKQVVDMWRSLGLKVFQVSRGDY